MKRNTLHSSKRAFGAPGKRSHFSRRNAHLVARDRILIVCEGAKTEPNYFLSFEVTTDVYGVGQGTMQVVTKAMELNERKGPFKQIWCVFDKDEFPADSFDKAIDKVNSLADDGFAVAFSNQSFELWFVLHFELQQAALSRQGYITKLTRHLGQEYDKSDSQIFERVQHRGNEADAIRHAEKLAIDHGDNKRYSACDPMTTVHNLVKELRGVKRESIG